MRRVVERCVGEETERGSGGGRVLEGSGDHGEKDRGFSVPGKK